MVFWWMTPLRLKNFEPSPLRGGRNIAPTRWKNQKINRIDIIGDKLATEDRVTEAAEDAIDDLTKLVRKLTTANFSNILVTADHGFLYPRTVI